MMPRSYLYEMVFPLIYAVLVCVPLNTICISFIRVNHSLIAVPMDIPADAEEMDLSDNQISRVDFISGPLPALLKFTMNKNLLTEFPDFSNCTDVTDVSLQNNLLRYISAPRLDMLTRLTRLYLTSNNLHAIPDVPGPGNTLIWLNLNNNNFSELPQLQYLGPQLTVLHATQNNINHIPSERLNQTRKLTHLLVANNPLQTFPQLEPIVANLHTLNLQGCTGCSGIPSGVFPMLSNIRNLLLHYTEAYSIPADICLRGSLGMSFTMNLRGNPFNCDAEMRWLRLAQEAGVEVRDVTCETPDTVGGTEWDEVTWEDLGPNSMELYI